MIETKQVITMRLCELYVALVSIITPDYSLKMRFKCRESVNYGDYHALYRI